MEPRAPRLLASLKTAVPPVVRRRLRRIARRLSFRLKHRGPTATFRRIHSENYWRDSESVSGWGSSSSQTQRLVDALPEILQSVDTETLLDVPCGDFAWMSRVDRSGFTYIGGDIVPELIAENSRRYGDDRTEFRLLDLTVDDLPAADVVLVRDCLVHLSEALVWSALEQIRSSGSRYLLTTTYPDHHENRNIPTGRWRALNLVDPPFNFPEPRLVFLEGNTEYGGSRSDKSLALWPVSEIPAPPAASRVHPLSLFIKIRRLLRRGRGVHPPP